MSYEITYDLTDNRAKFNAMKDAQEFLGKAKFRKVVSILQNDRTSSRRMLILGLALVGIQGYPAEVMIDMYVPKQLELDL